ncbi:MAG: GIY-YIG nuclease family protein [Verrucomicrobiota bacterium]
MVRKAQLHGHDAILHGHDAHPRAVCVSGDRRMPKTLPKPWLVYMLRCSNGCLYTGIATDVQQRLKVHNSGKGSAYVRAHHPARAGPTTLAHYLR